MKMGRLSSLLGWDLRSLKITMFSIENFTDLSRTRICFYRFLLFISETINYDFRVFVQNTVPHKKMALILYTPNPNKKPKAYYSVMVQSNRCDEGGKEQRSCSSCAPPRPPLG